MKRELAVFLIVLLVVSLFTIVDVAAANTAGSDPIAKTPTEKPIKPEKPPKPIDL